VPSIPLPKEQTAKSDIDKVCRCAIEDCCTYLPTPSFKIAFTLAPTRGLVHGSTTLRFFSLPRLNRSCASARTYSDSSLSQLQELATNHQSSKKNDGEHRQVEEPTDSREPSSETTGLRAHFIPHFERYELGDTLDRWRHRGKSDFQYSQKARSPASGAADSFVWFKKHHIKRLEPPFQGYFWEQRGLDYLQSNKMRSFVQVLTTPTADTPGTTLVLHFDNKRYLIGSIAEGTQRACVQMGAKLLKVSECFITGRTEWQNTGGLIGMILTLADVTSTSQAAGLAESKKRAAQKAQDLGVQDDPHKVRELEDAAQRETGGNGLTIFGPLNMNHMLATARRFVFRKGMPLNVQEIGADRHRLAGEDEWAPHWADQNIKVWPMSIRPSSTSMPSSPTEAKSASPRKRSIEEVYEGEVPEGGRSVGPDRLTPDQRDQLTAKAVVGEMFNSTWRLDTLYPTRLADVKMPATIFIRNSETNKIERYKGPLPSVNLDQGTADLEVLVRKPWPGALVESLPPTQPAKEAISYIIRNHTQRGKFNPKNAIELKVAKGRNWASLANGESVENEDGQTVTPEQVLGPSKEGGGLAVIDLPDPSYIENLIARPEWREPKVMSGVGAVVWICGPGVALDSRLRNFMIDLKELEHVVSSPDYCPNNIALDSAAAATIRLQQIDGKRYRVPTHGNGNATENHINTPLVSNAQAAVRGQIVQLEPKVEVQRKDAVVPLDIQATIDDLSKEVLDEAHRVQELVNSDAASISKWTSTLPDKDVEITTLGTGSALPSKYRNVSATLLRVPGWGSMLFDCGENTLGQMKRAFSPEEFEEIISGLRLIIISHMHADHHLGTVSVIRAWYDKVHNSQPASTPLPSAHAKTLFDEKRLAVVSEPAMASWLAEYSAVEDYGFSRIAPLTISPAFPNRDQTSRMSWFVHPSQLNTMEYQDRRDKLSAMEVSPSLIGLKDVQACLVKHCHGARALSVTWPSGFKASYSGDCRPSKDFAKIGNGSTVCIHEATFDDELQGDAEAKNHSTTSEALGVAQAMGAKACVLTHFSQRYQKLPVLEHSGEDDANGDDATITQDVPMLNADEAGVEDEASANPDEMMERPVDDNEAPTLPAQIADNASGQQHDLPDKKPSASESGPAAVNFKLKSNMKVCVAFDYMRVRVGEIAEMQHFTPALLKLFTEEEKKKDAEAAAAAEVLVSKKGGKKEKQSGAGG
jgi:ribonuclease Z